MGAGQDAREEPGTEIIPTRRRGKQGNIMSEERMPNIMAIFNRMIEGDDALLLLAARRFAEAGIGAEIYPGSPENFASARRFLSDSTICTAHLPHALDSSTPDGAERVLAFIDAAAGRLRGMVSHDSRRMAADLSATYETFARLDEQLRESGGPALYIEYACGLPFEQYLELIGGLERFEFIGSCVDIGHLAIQACRDEYAQAWPDADVCAIKPDHPHLGALLPEIQAAVERAFVRVLVAVYELSARKVPLHIHMHNGHPLSTFSPYHVCDHLSFFWTIPLPCEYNGRRSVDGFYDLRRLEKLFGVLRDSGNLSRMNLMLEIHPQPGRRPLEEHSDLFAHWSDLTNAESMNYWLDLICQNAMIVRSLLQPAN